MLACKKKTVIFILSALLMFALLININIEIQDVNKKEVEDLNEVKPSNGDFSEVWNTTWGSEYGEWGSGLCLDSNNNSVIVGTTNSSGIDSAYVVKFNPLGTVQWSRTLGTYFPSHGSDVFVDAYDNIYVSGTQYYNDTINNRIIHFPFAFKLNSSGATEWSYVNYEHYVHFLGITVDSLNNTYITGYKAFGTIEFVELYLCKINKYGQESWNVTWGANYALPIGIDVGIDVKLDLYGNIYVCGMTNSSNEYNGYDACLLKFDSGGVLDWVTIWGGSQDEGLNAMSIDDSNNIYTIGYTSSYGNGGNDLCLLKFDSDGDLTWNVTWGGPGEDQGAIIAFDLEGNLCVAGKTTIFGSAGPSDLCLVTFDPSTGGELYSTIWGGDGYEGGFEEKSANLGLDIDAEGNVFVAGSTDSFGAGSYDAFLVKFMLDPESDSFTVTSPTWSSSWQAGTVHEITWTSMGSIYYVNISLYYEGIYYETITPSTPNDGSYSWTLSDIYAIYGDHYQIKIEDTSNPSTYDMSDTNFEIEPLPDSLTVIGPTSSTSWQAGSTHTIIWSSTGLISDVIIKLYYLGSYHSTIKASTPNNGSYSWTLSDTYTNYGDFYQIRIEDISNPSTFNVSAPYFEITAPEIDSITVTSPSSSTSWQAGTVHEITWTSTGSVSNVNISLYYMGNYYKTIASSTPNDGSYSWSLDASFDNYGDGYQIRIQDVNDPSTFDQTTSYFEITEPEGGTTPPGSGLDLIVIIAIIIAIIGVIILLTGAVTFRRREHHRASKIKPPKVDKIKTSEKQVATAIRKYEILLKKVNNLAQEAMSERKSGDNKRAIRLFKDAISNLEDAKTEAKLFNILLVPEIEKQVDTMKVNIQKIKIETIFDEGRKHVEAANTFVNIKEYSKATSSMKEALKIFGNAREIARKHKLTNIIENIEMNEKNIRGAIENYQKQLYSLLTPITIQTELVDTSAVSGAKKVEKIEQISREFQVKDVKILRGGDWTIEGDQSIFNYKVKLSNLSNYVISNIQIIITSIPPGLILKSDKLFMVSDLSKGSFISPTFKFGATESCCGNQIESVATFRDFKGTMHTITIEPFEITYVCNLLVPKPISESKFEENTAFMNEKKIEIDCDLEPEIVEKELSKILSTNNFYILDKVPELDSSDFRQMKGYAEGKYDKQDVALSIRMRGVAAETTKLVIKAMSEREEKLMDLLKDINLKCDDLKSSNELILEYSKKIENVIDNIDNLEEFLMNKLGGSFERIRHVYERYKNGEVGKIEFVKLGAKIIGKKFLQIFLGKYF